ncbi:MAG: hypothetical protein QF879_15250 [Candidatus Latescibacteria bacterium]|nr:hypothetical protein [Candidatus Latescibacterota bacterium]
MFQHVDRLRALLAGRVSISLTGRLTPLIVRCRMIFLQENAEAENNESIKATCQDEF